MKPANRNRWGNFKDSIARWKAMFPPIHQVGTDRLIEFARRVLEAGDREQVYRVLQAPDPFNYQAGSGKSYIEHMRETLKRTGGLYLFYGGGPWPTRWGQLRTPARVAYHDPDGSIQEEEVEDLGALIRRLRPDDVEASLCMGHVCPVVLDSRAWARESSHTPEKVRFRIELESDIWFPRVLNFYDRDNGEEPHQGPDDMYDNSELAARHTPRLNRFIASVRESALDLGAQWELEEFDEPGLHVHYIPMCHEAGIALDLPPAARA